MKHREGFTLVEMMIVVVIIGVLASIAIPNYIRMQVNAKEARVKSDVHTVQMVAEDYGVANDGRYSDAAGDLTPLLPNAALMDNSFTKVATEPQFGAAAATSGQVGIQV
ncbi:MAG: type IV pilin protein, partial [Candidatus Krumholzibacteriia bacterium]